MNAVHFEAFSHRRYEAVRDFLVELNRDKVHINWNWARWEWMYAHPYCDREKLGDMGLWLEGERVVGAAVFDLFPGEVLCAALDGYEELLPEIIRYAQENLRNENGLGIAVRDGDVPMIELLTSLGYVRIEQAEPILCRSLEDDISVSLPEGFTLREIHFPEDDLAYNTVIWKGFGHEGDEAELQKMLQNPAPLPPHRRPQLCLALADERGEFAAHCTCWFDERTDYAYVEPVCTIPQYRGLGLGRAVVLEALGRCQKLGAKSAFVISDQEFYRKLGFAPYANYTFYRIG